MAVTDVDAGEVRLPDNFGITIFHEFLRLKRQGPVPTPSIDADDLYPFFRQKQGAFPIHPGAFHQILLRTPGIIRAGLNQDDIQRLNFIADSCQLFLDIFHCNSLTVRLVPKI